MSHHLRRRPRKWTCPLIPHQVERASIPERQLTIGHQLMRAVTLAEFYLKLSKRTKHPELVARFRATAFGELRAIEQRARKCC